MKRAGLTLREVITQQGTDPAYQDMRAARDKRLAAIADARWREQRPLLDDLAEVGVVLDWVGRLLSIPTPDARIYPILLHHLRRSYSQWLLEWIGRAFGAKPARPMVWDVLVGNLKRHELEDGAADGVMAAISELATPSDLPTLIDLASDGSLGARRVYLVGNLMRSKRPEARATLLRSVTIPDLAKEINARLVRSRA